MGERKEPYPDALRKNKNYSNMKICDDITPAKVAKEVALGAASGILGGPGGVAMGAASGAVGTIVCRTDLLPGIKP